MKKFLTFLLLLASSATLMAADIIVTTAEDGTADGSGVPAGSLREAIANAASGDVIKFNIQGTGKIELKNTLSITGAGKTLVIDGLNLATNKPVVITKSGEAAASSRCFNIANGAGNEGLNVTIKNISFEGASVSGNGAVINSGNSAYTTPGAFTVTIENCRFTDCKSTIDSGSSSGGGGACFVSHGTKMIITNCLFTNNQSLFSAGPDGGKSYGGGAIGSTGSGTAMIIVTNSTFYGNYTDGRGGAIFIGHAADLINCTISGNEAQRGGGLWYHNATAANLINCIFTHNYSPGTYAATADLYRNSGTATVNLLNSIVGTTNVPESAFGANCTLFTDGMPLFAAYINNQTGNKVPVLADNKGWYATVALIQNGAATGKGIATVTGFTVPTVDQRGATRKTPPCIGAFEYDGTFDGTEVVNTLSSRIYAAGDQIILTSETNGAVSVYNLSGICVYQAKIKGETHIRNFPKGIYIVKFTEKSGNVITSKVILK